MRGRDAEAPGGVRELLAQGVRQFDLATPGVELGAVKGRDAIELCTWEMNGAAGVLEAIEVGRRKVEDAAVQEDDRAEGLVQGGSGDAAFGGEIVEERDDLGRAHVTGMPALVEADEGADPVEVCLLGARGVVKATERRMSGFEEGHLKVSTRASRKLRPEGENRLDTPGAGLVGLENRQEV